MEGAERLTIRCGEELAQALKEVLDEVEGASPKLTEQKNLSGDISSYVLIAHVTVTTLGLLLTRLKTLPDILPIRSVEIGGAKFTNLTRKEVEKILSDHIGKAKRKK